MMKTIIFLIIFGLSGSVFGQYSRPVTPTPTPKVYDTADDLIKLKPTPTEKLQLAIEANNEANRWKSVATNDEEPPTMWFYQTARRVRSDVEVWLKVVSPKPIKTPGYPPVIYSMYFTVFHCGTGRRTVEKVNVYDAKGRLVESLNPIRFGDYPREAVNPGSVEEVLYNFFCS